LNTLGTAFAASRVQMDEGLLPRPVEPHTYTVYPGRYWVLTLFSLCSALSAVMWIALAPIEGIAQTGYGVSSTAINLISLLFLILYLPASILCMYTVEKYGTRTTLLIGAGCNALGTSLKYIGALPAVLTQPELAFGLVVAGQVRVVFLRR
jgi:uncharacterized membrane protein YqaE (UPF0057 family)